MNLEKICADTIEIALKAGDYIKKNQGLLKTGQIETKGHHDFVTSIDKTSEQMIIQGLSNLLPEADFLAEESAGTADLTQLTWIIDPLDGTTNFIHGLPLFTVSIGLCMNNEMVLGVIYEPNTNECFHAFKGGGALLNGQPIKVSAAKTLNDSLLATGFPYYDYGYLNAYMEFLKFTVKETRGLRRLGSAALDMAWVACGRFEGFYEYGLRPWDVAAGACIVTEAGGKVTDFSNGKNFLLGREIIASNGNIHHLLCSEIQEYFFKGKLCT